MFRVFFRAFFSTLFTLLGVGVALFTLFLLCYLLFASKEEKNFSSSISLLPDAKGERKKLESSTPLILQITLEGEIGREELTGKKIEALLLDSREDAFAPDRVKGILLVINSPGGGAIDSDRIYRLLKEYRTRYSVPIYAFVDGLCASGGYYIACASEKIFASSVSLVGSIGVLLSPPFLNVSEPLQKWGIQTETLSAGKDKDAMNPLRPWKEGEGASYRHIVASYYQQFVSLVAHARSLDPKLLEEKLGAVVLPADEAVTAGLIDGSGVDRAYVLTQLVQKAGITGAYQVVGYDSHAWWKRLFEERSLSPLWTGRVRHEVVTPSYEIPALLYR